MTVDVEVRDVTAGPVVDEQARPEVVAGPSVAAPIKGPPPEVAVAPPKPTTPLEQTNPGDAAASSG
jgi:hypothetical protein